MAVCKSGCTYFMTYDSESVNDDPVEMSVVLWEVNKETVEMKRMVHSLIQADLKYNDETWVTKYIHGIKYTTSSCHGMNLESFKTLFFQVYIAYGCPPIYANGVSMDDIAHLSFTNIEIKLHNYPLDPWTERVNEPVHRIIRKIQRDPLSFPVIHYDMKLLSNTGLLACDGIRTHDGFSKDPPATKNSKSILKHNDGPHCSLYDALEVGLHRAIYLLNASSCYLVREGELFISQFEDVDKRVLFMVTNYETWKRSVDFLKTVARSNKLELPCRLEDSIVSSGSNEVLPKLQGSMRMNQLDFSQWRDSFLTKVGFERFVTTDKLIEESI